MVIGGGISGLVAARELAISGHRVQVHEAAAAFGGCVGVHEVAGLALDAGAESFATRSTAVADLLGELGLGDDIVTPAARRRLAVPASAAARTWPSRCRPPASWASPGIRGPRRCAAPSAAPGRCVPPRT